MATNTFFAGARERGPPGARSTFTVPFTRSALLRKRRWIIALGLALAPALVAQQRPEPLVDPGAPTAVVPGGRSPDGRYEFAVIQARKDPGDYAFAILDAATRRVVKALDSTGGYFSFDDMKRSLSDGGIPKVRALWHRGSQVVAVTEANRGFSALFLFEVKGADVRELALPAYEEDGRRRVAAVLGRTGQLGTRALGTRLDRWDGDELRGELSIRPSPDSPSVERFVMAFSLAIVYEGPTAYVTLQNMSAPHVEACC
jgi:hypothetical protein